MTQNGGRSIPAYRSSNVPTQTIHGWLTYLHNYTKSTGRASGYLRGAQMQTYGEFSQIRIMPIDDDTLRIFVKIHNHLAGDIILTEKTFYSVPRTYKNVFHLFGEPALCYNQELLNLDLYSIIKIKFNDQILTVPRLKFLREGIRSPFSSEVVDSQLALPLKKINTEGAEKYELADKQIELFEEAV